MKNFVEMKLTDQEARLVFHVLDEILSKPYPKINKTFGNITIHEMMSLRSKIRFAEPCEWLGKKYEELTDDDLEAIYNREMDA